MEQSNKRRALGRGLEELFNSEIIDYNQLETKIYEEATKDEIIEINLNDLRSNPYQPRKNFDEKSLQELADSIKEHGVFQPIIVKKSIKGYDIIAGERRVKASKIAGKTTIPAIIRNFNDNQMMEIALLENLQRENLNSIEEAMAYNNLLKTLMITQEDLAKRLGKSRSHITNMLGLLTLPDEVKQLIVDNKITMGHARSLSKIEDYEKQKLLAQKIVEEQLSVRDIEKILNNEAEYPKKNKINREKSVNQYNDLEKDISEKLGTKIKISDKKIEIFFENTQDLNRILEILNLYK